MTSATLTAAKEYLALGLSVIPLKPRDKKPLIPSWRPYQERHATLEEIEKWFRDGTANIGIVTGKISGLAVVDFDTQDAIELAKAQNFPKGPLVKTGKGFHAYVRYQDGVRNFQKRDDLPGIDLRGDGGYVVAPPSIHESGRSYAWGKGRGLGALPLPMMPAWILATKPEHKATLADLINGAGKGTRNDALARVAGSVISKGMPLDETILFCKTWNAQNKPPLPDHELTATVKSVYSAHIRNNGEKADTECCEWPDPILFGEIATPDIQASILPGWLGDYAAAVATTTQTPPGMSVMMALAVVAACIQKRFQVARTPGHIEPLALWTATALPPASRKTAVGAGHRQQRNKKLSREP